MKIPFFARRRSKRIETARLCREIRYSAFTFAPASKYLRPSRISEIASIADSVFAHRRERSKRIRTPLAEAFRRITGRRRTVAHSRRTTARIAFAHPISPLNSPIPNSGVVGDPRRLLFARGSSGILDQRCSQLSPVEKLVSPRSRRSSRYFIPFVVSRRSDLEQRNFRGALRDFGSEFVSSGE